MAPQIIGWFMPFDILTCYIVMFYNITQIPERQ